MTFNTTMKTMIEKLHFKDIVTNKIKTKDVLSDFESNGYSELKKFHLNVFMCCR